MRYLETALRRDLEQQMVLLSGPRQCGKTTFSKWLLKTLGNSGEYLNWDQIKDRKRIQKQDWSEDAPLVVLDEIHKKKKWKTFLKGIFDTKPSACRLLVTGSARLEYFKKSGDSMFGRYHSWRLHPFCLGEDPLNLPPKERLERFLTRGGFPAPYLAGNTDDAQRWRNQRWSLLLREDLRDLAFVKQVQAIELMAELLKAYAGGMLSYANLAEDAEISPKTAKSWVHALEQLYLVTLITPFSTSIKRSLSKTPKVYFLDCGDLLEQSRGVQIENLVALNLLKRVNYIEDAFGDRIGLHYLRDKEKREVDFVITLNRKPVALIEVKTSFQEPDSSLIHFRNHFGEQLNAPFAIQLYADTGELKRGQQKNVVKNGVRIMSIQEFFSTPVATRNFWEV